MKRTRSGIPIIIAFVAFAAWTAAVCTLDMRPIGPNGSVVGLATVNGFLRDVIGVRMQLYTITDWLGLVPIAVAAGFAVLGLVQWIRRKRFLQVDGDILVLGGFYLMTMSAYLLFETVVINYRPVLINEFLEASYPSSTTLLTLCVMPTAIMQLNARIRHAGFRRAVAVTIAIFTAFMVIGRLLSGVHWFSDIVGGVLLSTGLVLLYRFACEVVKRQ